MYAAMPQPKLLIATGNPGKMREYRDLLRAVPYQLISLSDMGITDEVEETGVTFYENAALKTSGYAALSGLLTLADDSGLEVDALGGAPGVYSARYGELPDAPRQEPFAALPYERGVGGVVPAGTGPDGKMTDQDRVSLLLRNMEGVPWERRTARFRCVIAVGRLGMAESGQNRTDSQGNGEIPPTPIYERGASQAASENTWPDLSSIRSCVSAGEALPADILRRWQEKTGLTILDGIGSTEALHIFISNRADDYSPGSSGRMVPSYQAKIVDDAGAPVATGEIGRLLVKGGSMAGYYWNNLEKTAETMLGEWVNTGDTYYQDEAGYYIYCGRSDDMLKVGGIWCSPAEIESCLIEHPQVLEAAIVGRADDDQLIKPEAFIVLTSATDSEEALSQELLDHCRNTLARYKFPRWFNYVDDLPKTATGKIQRFRLRK